MTHYTYLLGYRRKRAIHLHIELDEETKDYASVHVTVEQQAVWEIMLDKFIVPTINYLSPVPFLRFQAQVPNEYWARKEQRLTTEYLRYCTPSILPSKAVELLVAALSQFYNAPGSAPDTHTYGTGVALGLVMSSYSGRQEYVANLKYCQARGITTMLNYFNVKPLST